MDTTADPKRPPVGSPPKQQNTPLQPRALAPAPLSNPHNSAPTRNFPPHQYPPQQYYQSPPHGYNQPPYAYAPGPQHLQQPPPGNYPPPQYNHPPPAANADRVHPPQSLYQATPGGPYRPTPSLAGQQPVHHAPPHSGPPNPNYQAQSPHPANANYGNWYGSNMQHVYHSGTGNQAGGWGWQQQYAQNFYGHAPQQFGLNGHEGTFQTSASLGTPLDHVGARWDPQAQEGNAAAKKVRKPRVSKKKAGAQQDAVSTGTGQSTPDPQIMDPTQQGTAPVKKTRKPRASKKNPNPQQDLIPTGSSQGSPGPQTANQAQKGTAPVKKTRKPRVSKKNAIPPQSTMHPTGPQANNQPHQEAILGRNGIPPVLQEGHAQAPSRSIELEAASSLQRLESRQGLDESAFDEHKHKMSKNGPNGTPIRTTELQAVSTVKNIGRQSILVDDSDDSDDDEADEDEEDDDDPGPIDQIVVEGSDEESVSDDEYDTIMSQVNRYKGGLLKAMGGRHQNKPASFGLLNSLADMEPEDEPQEDPQENREEDPQGPKRLRKVRHRGPHPAAEVTGEIKLRLGLANEAFANSKIAEAKRLVDEIIRINAETYEAWNLLSSIFQEQNMVEDALMALIVAAHLRPKYIDAWFNAGDYALTSMGPVTDKLLIDAQFCFSSAIRQVPTSLEARRRKVQVVIMRGNYNLAARDLVYILRTVPYDLEIIRELAMVYIDLGDGKEGTELYRKAIKRFRTNPDDFDLSIDWNDLHTCAVLHSLMGKEEDSLKEMKSLARWLLGREDEMFWDDVTENDCEWDVDDSRRISQVEKYTLGKHPLSSYGEGLPIELRVYFGKYRLKLGHFEEAMRHFELLLSKKGEAEENMVQSYSHLIIDVANSFYDAEQYKEAISFYEALKEVPDEMTAEAYFKLGKCLLHDDRAGEAEVALREACAKDEENIEARIELARMYEMMDEAEQAFVYVNQVLELESIKQPKMYRRRRGNFTLIESNPAKSFLPGMPRKSHRMQEKDEQERYKADLATNLRDRYSVLRKETDAMRAGNPRATDAWMDAARALTEDFRTCRAFYPWDRKEFEGYTTEEALQAKTSLRLDLEAINQEHAEDLGSQSSREQSKIPNHYRGISFKDWIDIFCEYAFCLARRGRSREAYDVCEAGIHAICFMFNKQDMFMFHIAYCVCALIGNDEETCVGMARWFMVRYQFCTDSYRMFAALLRMCHSPISWYSSGPTQKFILRQIKTMDWVLSNDERRNVIKGDKANYTHHDEFGKTIVNEELDVSLLMAYGHILVAGSSFVYALNYFHRALSVDPENPMIMLSLGLSYIQYGLKRQVDNRQYVITQGLTFMHRYYDLRLNSPHFEERQEAHYNMARCYHLVALTNLAIPFYRKVLKGGEDEENQKGVNEDWCLDAAYNLQTIYTTAGNMELAQSLTRKWLVI